MYDVRGLLTVMGPGRMGTTAYDTAWVARLADLAPTLSNHALEWISEHQLADGSWGAEQPLYYHDRIVSTLAAMLVLARRGRRVHDRVRIENGLKALDRLTSDATRRLASDANGAPAGFEMIVPTLVAEAEKLGIIKQQGDRILGRLGQMRRAKLAKLKGIKINRYVTTALSAELAGEDALDMLDIDNLQESNGSVGNSPSATAHFAMYARPGDREALLYLRDVLVDGGAPFVSPFENFERIWILWNLHIGGLLTRDIMPLAQPHIDSLEAQWKPGQGLGFSSTYSLMDGDDTSLGYDLLTDLGHPVDLEAVLGFEEKDHFRCFNLEVNASIDVNIHVLGALRRAGCGVDHPSVQKALGFIRKRRLTGKYWIDKWNASPFYTTAHAIIFCQGYDDEMCQTAVDWILKMQNSNGAWGFYRAATAEETAYCLQALSLWRKAGGKVPGGRIELGARWLRGHTEPPYPPLWIGKSLYCPDLLVQSTILSALALAQG
ncbi:MAG: cyclase [Chloroflexota bacterium]